MASLDDCNQDACPDTEASLTTLLNDAIVIAAYAEESLAVSVRPLHLLLAAALVAPVEVFRVARRCRIDPVALTEALSEFWPAVEMYQRAGMSVDSELSDGDTVGHVDQWCLHPEADRLLHSALASSPTPGIPELLTCLFSTGTHGLPRPYRTRTVIRHLGLA